MHAGLKIGFEPRNVWKILFPFHLQLRPNFAFLELDIFTFCSERSLVSTFSPVEKREKEEKHFPLAKMDYSNVVKLN